MNIGELLGWLIVAFLTLYAADGAISFVRDFPELKEYIMMRQAMADAQATHIALCIECLMYDRKNAAHYIRCLRDGSNPLIPHG